MVMGGVMNGDEGATEGEGTVALAEAGTLRRLSFFLLQFAIVFATSIAWSPCHLITNRTATHHGRDVNPRLSCPCSREEPRLG